MKMCVEILSINQNSTGKVSLLSEDDPELVSIRVQDYAGRAAVVTIPVDQLARGVRAIRQW